MSPRGGRRTGAGRPSRSIPTTKVAVYYETREKLNEHARHLSLPVVELMHQIVENPKFSELLEDIKHIISDEKLYQKD